MASTWYYRIGEKVHGPVSSAELKRLVKQGKIAASDFVSQNGKSYVPAIHVKGLVTDQRASKPAPDASAADNVYQISQPEEPMVADRPTPAHSSEYAATLRSSQTKPPARFRKVEEPNRRMPIAAGAASLAAVVLVALFVAWWQIGATLDREIAKSTSAKSDHNDVDQSDAADSTGPVDREDESDGDSGNAEPPSDSGSDDESQADNAEDETDLPPKPEPAKMPESGRDDEDKRNSNDQGSRPLADVIAKARFSVVLIDIVGSPSSGQASGVVVSDKGIVLTNHHVLKGAREVWIEFQDRSKKRIDGVLALDPLADLAALEVKLDDASTQPLPMALSIPRRGDRVVALCASQRSPEALSEGVVRAIRSTSQLPPGLTRRLAIDGGDSRAKWIETTIPLSPGNSGGPLVNLQGKLVGINSWSWANGQNMSFAISANEAVRLLDHITGRYVPLPPGAKTDATPKPVELPSGLTIDVDTLFGESIADYLKDPNRLLRKDGTELAEIKSLSGRSTAFAAHNKGKLDGIVYVEYDSGHPAVFATYEEQRPDGNVMVWHASGERDFLAQYVKGRENGFLLFFRNDQLAVVQEYGGGKLTATHLINNYQIVESYDPQSTNKEVDGVLAAIADSLEKYKQDEIAIKESVRQWDEDQRQQRAAAKSVAARAKIRARRIEESRMLDSAIHRLRNMGKIGR